jgi:hypothetical protein
MAKINQKEKEENENGEQQIQNEEHQNDENVEEEESPKPKQRSKKTKTKKRKITKKVENEEEEEEFEAKTVEQKDIDETFSNSSQNTSPASSPSLSPRQAYKKGDLEASRMAHDKKLTEALNPPPEMHSSAGFYVKALVFGGLDGILEMFAVMNGIVGSGHCTAYVIVLGFASLIADALTMALGDWLSERAGLFV